MLNKRQKQEFAWHLETKETNSESCSGLEGDAGNVLILV